VDQIVADLQAAQVPHIALFTLNVLSDAPDGYWGRRSLAYDAAIREVAAARGVTCLDLAEKQRAWFAQTGQRGGVLMGLGGPLMMLHFVLRFAARIPPDTLSRLFGGALTVDGIHTNTLGGEMVRDLASAWLAQVLPGLDRR
jgi:hypothetical protein